MIRAVIFDMYETLVTLMTGPQCFSRDMAALAGADVTAFRAAWRRTEDDRMLGRTTFEEAVRSSLEACGAWSQTAYEAILHQRLASREICLERLHPQILPMLDALKKSGAQTGLITNCQSEEVSAIRRSVLWPYFDASIMSFEVGLMKPDPAIFRCCMERLGVNPPECLYVGDGGSRELEAASDLGMRPLQAAWYLLQGERGSLQPVGRLAGFVQAEKPTDVLRYLK